MRALLISLLVLTGCIAAYSQGYYRGGSAAPSSGPSYLIHEDAEGTGTPSGWTDVANISWDDTTMGTGENLRLATPNPHTYFAISDNGELWLRLRFRRNLDTGTTERKFIAFETSDGTELARVGGDDGSALRITHGSATTSTVSDMSESTNYYVWVYYKKGTGSDGEMSVAWSTSLSEPTSGDEFASLTNGTSTGDVGRISFYCVFGASGRYIRLDDIILDDESIGNDAF